MNPPKNLESFDYKEMFSSFKAQSKDLQVKQKLVQEKGKSKCWERNKKGH